jgi:hypothetical protein
MTTAAHKFGVILTPPLAVLSEVNTFSARVHLCAGVNAIRRWWRATGRKRYPKAKSHTADGSLSC